MRRPSPALIVALVALVVALSGTAIAIKADSSPPLKVCIATKEGKAIVTPKHGVCAKGYTLTEVNKEGPEGKQGEPGASGSSIVAHLRSATPVTTQTGSPVSVTL